MFASLGLADKIYLKNGKVYDGKLIGRSERRFLFSVDADGVIFQMSFFPEDVKKIELGKDTVESQIPYLKDVETMKVEVNKEDNPKTYELSLYNKNPGMAGQEVFSDVELKKALDKDEYEYYHRFNDIIKRYADKFAAIQNIYMNLTTASDEDFASAKQYMDELYFELNNIFVPEAFKESHVDYLASVKGSFLAFNALQRRMLDEASKQIKISEDSKQKSMDEFRKVILAKKAALPPTPEKEEESSAQE